MDVIKHPCHECNEATATIACRCTNPATTLCRSHVLDHMDKAPNEPHLMTPITSEMVFERVEDSVEEDKKVMYASSLRRKFGDLKVQAVQYIEKRLDELEPMPAQFKALIDTERAFLVEELEKLKLEIDGVDTVIREKESYDEIVD
jgi:hypothetical protein